jgi:hypothetical protein
MTFITTENIEGFPGEPIEYEVDDSWRNDPDGPYGPDEDPHPNDETGPPAPPAHEFVNQDWLALYDQFPLADAGAIETIPPVSTDRVPADGQNQFITSDQGESCHSADNSPFGPNLIVQDVDVSPHAEWRWSMMGLSGRDPIFHAQLETETTLHGKPDSDLPAAQIENLCLSCHGVMGQRQFRLDHPDEPFTIEAALAHDEDDPLRVYGGLARDGVSCAACHRIKDDSSLPLADVQNGRFLVDAPTAGILPIYGQFEDPSERSMLGTLAMRPVEGAHFDSSRVCASCHTVFLPVLDAQGRVVDQKFEQATFLEWVNSDYRDGGSQAQSCQFCHMPDVFAGEALNPKIANIQDQDFPITSFLAPEEDITVEPRSGYRRHMLQSINVFALELFRQFPDILGVRTRSFMTGLTNGLPQAIDNAFDGALHRSAAVQILSTERNGDEITAAIKVTNLVGHRLPSGVGFRRLILEFDVVDADQQVVWSSGRTNSLGVVVDDGSLPSGSRRRSAHRRAAYQPLPGGRQPGRADLRGCCGQRQRVHHRFHAPGTRTSSTPRRLDQG